MSKNVTLELADDLMKKVHEPCEAAAHGYLLVVLTRPDADDRTCAVHTNLPPEAVIPVLQTVAVGFHPPPAQGQA